MDLKNEIRAAIGAHGLWKGRLSSAIQTGKCDVSPSVAQQDNQCAFGKWLGGPSVDPATRRSSEYAECKELHRKFHIAAARALSLALAGKKQEARNILARLMKASRDHYISPYNTALIYKSLGQTDEALDWLEKACDDRFWMMAFLKVDPRWDPLRSHPRFQEILRRTGLP